jgi:signal transduction histidine kinase/ligand-binding sensor domain-containing protein
MNKNYYTYLITFWLYWWASNLQAQQYRFKTYSLEEGLPQSEVTDILQDIRGSIWIATHGGGVARFNGKTFTSFNEQSGIINNRVKKLYEDSQGNLWFVTERGITKYNGKNFENFSEKEGFISGVDFQMAEDNTGRIWFLIRREKNITKILSWQNDRFSDFTNHYLQLVQNNEIYNISIQNQQTLLIQTKKGFFEYADDKLTMSPINQALQDKNLIKARLYKANKQNKAQIIVEKQDELELYNYNDKELTLIKNLGKSPLDELSGFCEDKYGNYWVASNKKGFWKIDSSNKITYFTEKNGLIATNFEAILADTYGDVWLSSYGRGLIRYMGDQFIQYYTQEGLETGLVWAIHQSADGTLWVGENGDFPFSKFENNKFQPIPIQNKTYIRRVHTINSLPDGTLLVGTVRGLWQKGGNLLIDVSKKYGLPEGIHITAIAPTNQGIWFGSHQDGVFFYDNQTQKTTSFNTQSHNLVSDLVNNILEDSQQRIWICTNYGISIYDGYKMLNYSKKNGLPSEYVIGASEDAYGNIWIATFGGLLRYGKSTQKFDIYRETEGILSNNIYSVLVDKKNQVWIGTQLGVSKIQIDKTGNIVRIRNYDKNSGFSGLEANENAIAEDKDGNIWFGTVRGVIKYKASNEASDSENLRVNLAELQLYLQNTNWLSEQYASFHKGLMAWSLMPQDLVLPYDKNYLSFSFELANHKLSESVRYQWYLEGLEDDWNKKSSKTEVIYTNLPPGNYTFKVRACLPDGTCSQEITNYKFRIKPAFWQTRWFYIIIFLVLALGIVVLIRQRFLLIENQKKMLQTKVAEASKALISQNDELIKQKKEIEQQKANLQQLNATKDRFFSILAHDIKGPLNSLTAFLNIMTDHLDEMSQEDIRFMSSNLNKSVKNLYSLLENVLSWSRSQMGVLEYVYENANLYHLIENNIQLLSVSAQNKGISLHNEADKDIDVWIDANSINTVLRNLLSNAIKFTSVDGTVTVRTKLKDGEVEISVADTGVGMSQEVIDKIFKVDSRYSTKGTANEVGTGLGLVLVKEFVEKNHGLIRVESQEGKGSTFIFTLPLAQPTTSENKIIVSEENKK